MRLLWDLLMSRRDSRWYLKIRQAEDADKVDNPADQRVREEKDCPEPDHIRYPTTSVSILRLYNMCQIRQNADKTRKQK
jgi:hypothetical protein